MPLLLWKYPDIGSWTNPPGWEQNITADSNPNTAYLMMETDITNQNRGFAPFFWDIELGNVLAIRADGKHLDVNYLEIMSYFARYKLQTMFEDAMGAGRVGRTKHEVLEFANWENMRACESEIDARKDGMDI